VLIESNGSISLRTEREDGGRIIAKYEGRDIYIFRDSIKTYAQYSNDEDTGWIPCAADVRNGMGIYIHKSTSLTTGNEFYEVAGFSLETGEHLGTFYDNGVYADNAHWQARLDSAVARGEPEANFFMFRSDWTYGNPSQEEISNIYIHFDDIINLDKAQTNSPDLNISASDIVNNVFEKPIRKSINANSASYSRPSFDSKIYNLGNGEYAIETDEGVDKITGVGSVQFSDQSLDITSDIKATFDQVTGMDTVDGVIFRLYNAAFSRLPDAGGLENWINANSVGGYSYQETAIAFIDSQESINRYGSGQSDTDYINTVYNNVLDRDADSQGLSHYEGLLSSGEKSRAEMMFDFSESPENRGLFSEQTGIT